MCLMHNSHFEYNYDRSRTLIKKTQADQDPKPDTQQIITGKNNSSIVSCLLYNLSMV